MVVHFHEVRPTILVVVEEGRDECQPIAGDPGRRGDVAKVAVAQIPVEPVGRSVQAADGCVAVAEVQVEPAVAVVVPKADPVVVGIVDDAAQCCLLGEHAAAVVHE